MEFSQVLKQMPLFPILYGIFPHAVNDVADVLLEAGFLSVLVPLSTPEAYTSLQQLCLAYNNRVLVGGAEVQQFDDVEKIANQGATLILTAHYDTNIIQRAKQLNLFCISSCSNLEEAYHALLQGADAILYIEESENTAASLQNLREKLPQNAQLILPNKHSFHHMEQDWEKGINGFAIVDSLYQPGIETSSLTHHAKKFTEKMQHLLNKRI